MNWTCHVAAAPRLDLEALLKRPEATHTRSHFFASPSAAAPIEVGRSVNGRKEWAIEGRRTTYGEWETECIEETIKQRILDE